MINLYYSFIREFIHKEIGIHLEQDKDYMINFRLQDIARKHGCTSTDIFLKMIYNNQPKLDELKNEIIDSLTTTETFFFRDSHYFDLLKSHILPSIIQKNISTQTIRIWSAVCSSGQEPYSIRLLINENFPELANWNISIYCSDVNSKVLNQAKKGEYSLLEIQRGLTNEFIEKYFTKSTGYHYKINEDHKIQMHFLKLNLLKDEYPIPPMDIVFLRNVLIYLEESNQSLIIRKIKDILKPNGVLLLGSTEYLKNFQKNFIESKKDKAIYYQKKD